MIAAACPEALRCDDAVASSAFIRFDPPELHDGSLVVRAVPADLREGRRLGPATPLAYLYERVPDAMPDTDQRFDAGHYDETRLVWSFSGELTGILGITEPTSPE
ncbi:hypothetical protein [Spirillospora sp. CA-294931]|uniref:hypothetical protein n=1 Tax=Spirillospora sp. CA-294931 TaxID=3240042 RepID=UPI003D8FE51D